MIVVESLNDVVEKYNEKKINVTIGNFDGVHLGHQSFLNEVKKQSLELNAKFVVITFVPHPLQILKSHTGFLINTYEERRELLKEVGVDYLVEINFTRDFSTLNPESFLRDYIFSSKVVERLYLGYDFAFGANKSGDHNLAKKVCQECGIQLILQEEFKVSSHNVSSTEVRGNILNGDFEKVSKLLGRNHFMSGRVIKGEGRGRLIGFPTANLGYSKDLIIPAKGVYISQVMIKNMIYNSVTNIGNNPTFNTGYEIHVESHLLDFSHDIYGEEIKVQFIKKIRDEKKFGSVNDLVSQIGKDVETAKEYFKNV